MLSHFCKHWVLILLQTSWGERTEEDKSHKKGSKENPDLVLVPGNYMGREGRGGMRRTRLSYKNFLSVIYFTGDFLNIYQMLKTY